MMRHSLRAVGLVLLLVAGVGCEQASDNAGSTSGPSIDVDCLKRRAPLLPGQGVGASEVEVACAPQ